MKLTFSPLALTTFAICLFALTGCGTAVYQPSRVAGFELEPQQEINDDDIEKAFAARPQVPATPSVSYYVFDDDYAEGVTEMLATLPQVKNTYRIPALMVSGERRFQNDHNHHGYYPPKESKPISMKKLRLLSARAQTDLLVVIDYGYRHTDSANGWAAMAPLIIPMFFVPMRDVTVESYVDSYVIDTRNGYLYGHVQTSEEKTEEYVSLFDPAHKAMIDDQFDLLMNKTGKLMTNLLAEERGNSLSPLKKEPAPKNEPAISARQDADEGQSR